MANIKNLIIFIVVAIVAFVIVWFVALKDFVTPPPVELGPSAQQQAEEKINSLESGPDTTTTITDDLESIELDDLDEAFETIDQELENL